MKKGILGIGSLGVGGLNLGVLGEKEASGGDPADDLFSPSDVGDWWNYTDLSTLNQDSGGAGDPVTAANDPIGYATGQRSDGGTHINPIQTAGGMKPTAQELNSVWAMYTEIGITNYLVGLFASTTTRSMFVLLDPRTPTGLGVSTGATETISNVGDAGWKTLAVNDIRIGVDGSSGFTSAIGATSLPTDQNSVWGIVIRGVNDAELYLNGVSYATLATYGTPDTVTQYLIGLFHNVRSEDIYHRKSLVIDRDLSLAEIQSLTTGWLA